MTEDDPVDLLLALWRETLAREDLDADSNFFVHGGHSLLGLVLLERVEERTGVDLRITDLFQCPTPARLGARVRAATNEQAGASPARDAPC
ncbi:phosphopantetheine-binding protein [Saccharopolyspora sp. MS10]|uniref:phosphopantetheine-binding protein n=1 Tax=Saccharopolyspora sp. MS10 TaxID=3385973 RepID=UPI0039A18775